MELCDLYLQEHDYAKASFCMEELIMSNPHNHLYHQRYAEVRLCYGLLYVGLYFTFMNFQSMAFGGKTKQNKPQKPNLSAKCDIADML